MINIISVIRNVFILNCSLLVFFCAPCIAQVNQNSQGDCSPTISDVNGNVTLQCYFGNRQTPIPGYKGDIENAKTIDDLATFVDNNVNKITYLDLSFDVEAYNSDSLDCEDSRRSGVNMCLNAKHPEFTSVSIILINSQRVFEDEICDNLKGCFPCTHGFCNVKGFFIPLLVTASQGDLYIKLKQIETERVILH